MSLILKGTYVATPVDTGPCAHGWNVGIVYGVVTASGSKQFSVRWERANRVKRYKWTYGITVLTDAGLIEDAQQALEKNVKA